MLPSSSQFEQIHRLWDELTEFAPAQTEAAIAHLFAGLARLIGADAALWFGAVRVLQGESARTDPTHGWRSPALHLWTPDAERERLIREFVRSLETRTGAPVGESIVRLMAGAGKFRVHRLRDGGIDLRAFRATSHYETYFRRAGVTDRMWIGFPLNRDTESHFVFDHTCGRRRFSARDAAVAAYGLRGIKWFHRALLLRHGVLAAHTRLTPTEWRVLPQLLSDRTEKEIAQKLGLTFDATHRHARGIYQKFAVRGRSGLMALWFGPSPSPSLLGG